MKTGVFFITGGCGAGKSTVKTELEKLAPDALVYDFDSHEPEDGDFSVKWRLETTDYWLQTAKENLNKGHSTFICGLAIPEEVITSKNFSERLNIRFILLDISEKEQRKRLEKRRSELNDTTSIWNDIEPYINHTRHIKKPFETDNPIFMKVPAENITQKETAKQIMDIIRNS